MPTVRNLYADAVAAADSGVGVRILGLAQSTVQLAAGAARGLASLPRLVDVLEQLAEETASIRKLATGIQRVEHLVDGALGSDELRRVPGAFESLLATVTDLNRAVAQLNAAISPLQGTAERLGRLVDRFPARGRREQTSAIAPPFVAPTDG